MAEGRPESSFNKIFVAVATAVLTALALSYFGLKGDPPKADPPPPTPAPTSAPAPTPTPILSEQPNAGIATPKPPTKFVPEPKLPTNSCPVADGMFWMQYPNTWYGPFGGGDGILFSSAGGFSVWNAQAPNQYGGYGVVIPYPDPYSQIARNEWTPLEQSRFSVCVDGMGRVFVIQTF